MKYFIISMAAILILSGTCFECWAVKKSSVVRNKNLQKPNILFIAVDDLRTELGCYGQTHIVSPNIDRLVLEGSIFLKNYCQFPICGPSRASILTGMRPDKLKIWNNKTHIRETLPDIITLPQYFKKHGYYTVGYGKIFHDKLTDDSLSWSEPGLAVESFHYEDYNNPITILMLEKMRKKYGTNIVGPPTDSADVQDNAYSDGQFTDMAIQTMKELKSSKNPFFLAVGFVRPHLPFNCPKKYWDLYESEQIPLSENSELPANFPDIPVYDSNWMRQHLGMPKKGPFSDSLAKHLNHGYFASVSFVDSQVGLLLEALREFGFEKNTIVVLWGDHGYLLNDHGIYGKHSNFEKAVHSPLIIRVPGSYMNQRIDKPTEFVDVFPSLCELSGLPVPDNLQGKSFVPLLKNPDQEWKQAAFSQYQSGEFTGYSVRTNRYRYTKWILRKTGDNVGNELYDYLKDPNEEVNLAPFDSYQSKIYELSKLFNKIDEY